VRLLFAIPHYFAVDDDGRYGSTRANPERRVAALTRTITALHQVFGARRYVVDLAKAKADPSPDAAEAEVEVIVCSTRGLHLLDRLPPECAYTHLPTDVEPLLLGFECQAALAEATGHYDYYCFIEDDLLLTDSLFFTKLVWFNAQTGPTTLLQPNRFEADLVQGGRRAYIDGDLRPAVTAPYQDVNDRPVLELSLLDQRYRFRRPLNPHSACYFLSRAQMEHWMSLPGFLDRDTSFVGPLESGATLGIMRTFSIYKPAPENVGFLEIEHLDPAILGRHAPVDGEESGRE
jgi:hypothetical protein